jgi:hypothetical protein
VIYSLSKKYFSPFSPINMTTGTLAASTPKYSASLSKSPNPSFLSEVVRRYPSGLVSSNVL